MLEDSQSLTFFVCCCGLVFPLVETLGDIFLHLCGIACREREGKKLWKLDFFLILFERCENITIFLFLTDHSMEWGSQRMYFIFYLFRLKLSQVSRLLHWQRSCWICPRLIFTHVPQESKWLYDCHLIWARSNVIFLGQCYRC